MKKLKSIILIAAMGMISYSAMAQNHIAVPSSVTGDFALKYPGVEVNKWKMNNNEYVANFKMNGRECDAFYSKDGDWLSTQVVMKHLKNLSPDIKAAIRNSQYASYHIDGVKRMHTPNQEMFIIEVDNNSGNKMIYDNLGSYDDRLLYYTSDGRLVKNVNNANE
ncbi:MAG: PepSY-like domain-containing protein [Bacteroidetes bacterium]|nr:PepSY-like domain-containing protein [Bacteroidota bacterium]